MMITLVSTIFIFISFVCTGVALDYAPGWFGWKFAPWQWLRCSSHLLGIIPLCLIADDTQWRLHWFKYPISSCSDWDGHACILVYLVSVYHPPISTLCMKLYIDSIIIYDKHLTLYGTQMITHFSTHGLQRYWLLRDCISLSFTEMIHSGNASLSNAEAFG